MHRMKSLALAAALLALPVVASAQSILIINGATGTSESGTTATITANLKTLHEAVGNTVTIADALPASFAGYTQIWDIRFSNTFALTAGQQTQYLQYLQGGGRVFMMGENSGFATRNNSIFSLIDAAGGGSVGFTSCNSTQTVNAPFTGPNAVTSVTYNAPGCFNGTGTGQWITNNGSSGTGLAWTLGTLANAPLGALTSILDVNFMQNNQTVNEQNLTKNLIGFVNNPPPIGNVVPEPSTYVLMATGLAGIIGMSRRRRTTSV